VRSRITVGQDDGMPKLWLMQMTLYWNGMKELQKQNFIGLLEFVKNLD
jgi:hypothetical protein